MHIYLLQQRKFTDDGKFQIQKSQFLFQNEKLFYYTVYICKHVHKHTKKHKHNKCRSR